jgi:hypothetical protein
MNTTTPARWICGSRFVQIDEKQEWWLQDILRKRDGLCA